MEKFLISVDLDDTLLTQEKTITDESVAYIQELERKGHHFIINTGRPHQGAVEYLKRLKDFVLKEKICMVKSKILY